MRIRSYAIHNKGGSPEPFYYEKNIGPLEVLVRITHCSVTKGDVQIISDDWGDTQFPVVPGHEIIGIVEELGKDVTGYNKGDRVGVGYQLEACFECEFCLEGNEQFCAAQKVIAVDHYGGLADHIIVDHRFAFKIPEKLPSASAAPLLSSGLTVFSAITRADMTKGAKIGVLGVGGLGYLALAFMKTMGHDVSAFSHSPSKKKFTDELGVNYIDAADVAELLKFNRQFDFILSTVNADYELDGYLRMLRPQGKFCLVSQPLNKMQTSLGLLYDYAQRTIFGNYTGSRKNMKDMLDFVATNGVNTLIEIMPFDKMDKAIEMVIRSSSPVRIVLEKKG